MTSTTPFHKIANGNRTTHKYYRLRRGKIDKKETIEINKNNYFHLKLRK